MKSCDEVFGLSYDGSLVSSTSVAVRQNEPGEIAIVRAREGYRVYRYMKAEEAFAIGQVAGLSALLDNADVDAASSGKTLTGTGDFTANEFNDGTFPSAYVSIDAGASIGQTRAIFSNRGSTAILTLDRAWTTALTTVSDYVTYDINYVSLADTDDVSVDATPAAGVAISAVTDEEWAWFQVKGFCPLVRSVGNTDALVRGEPITTSGTAGAARGTTSGGLAAADLTAAFGLALHATAEADAAGAGVAALLHCKWFC